MLVNPAQTNNEDEEHPTHRKDSGYGFHNHKGKTLHPVSKDLQLPPHARPEIPSHHAHHAQQAQSKTSATAAVELIRQKVAALYGEEPDVKEELQEAAQPAAKPLSKHQQFMQQLSTSGKSLAHIQTEWHRYYISLPDDEKHQVWREFYQANGRSDSSYAQAQAASHGKQADHHTKASTKVVVAEHLPQPDYAARHDRRTRSRIKRQILERVNISAQTQAKAKQHFQSLAFGIGTGFLVLVIFLFGFFNEMFIAPFIQPSRHVSATPIILSSAAVAASDTPEVIIPKINVQIPVVYDQKSVRESDIQSSLERGVIHYPTTVLPGQQGNASFFGHSSNNIFNKGKYKFAFVLLHELVPGDIFYLTYDKKVYSYRVFDKKIVPPSEVSVLGTVQNKPATATLITCDPPGTSTNRLVVWGEQISPDPSGAPAPATPPVDQSNPPTELPSEGPTLWKRFTSWLF